jgi:hypothetical protein
MTIKVHALPQRGRDETVAHRIYAIADRIHV